MKLSEIVKGRLIRCCVVALVMTVPTLAFSAPGAGNSQLLSNNLSPQLPIGFRPARSLSELNAGMQLNSVVKIWGPAQQKQEYESKRVLRWHYPDEVVLTFYDGGLVEFRSTSETRSLKINANHEPEVLPEPVVDKPDSTIAEDLLSEILREVPSEPDTPSTGDLDVNASPVEVKPRNP